MENRSYNEVDFVPRSQVDDNLPTEALVVEQISQSVLDANSIDELGQHIKR